MIKRIIAVVSAFVLVFTLSGSIFAQDPTFKSREVKIIVNDKEYSLCGYEVPGDPNGVKLRDIAVLFSGTSKQFNVTFNDGIVTIIPGQAYTPLGTELKKYDGTEKEGIYSIHRFILDGDDYGIEATLAEDYNYVPFAYFVSLLGVFPEYKEDGSIVIDTEAVVSDEDWG